MTTKRNPAFCYSQESLEVLLSDQYVNVTSVEQATLLIKQEKVEQKVAHVIGQLAFGVELQALEPRGSQMDTKWLTDFINAKVDMLKGANTRNPEYQDHMERFHTKMMGHTMTMNTASAMKSKILRAIYQIAEEFES